MTATPSPTLVSLAGRGPVCIQRKRTAGWKMPPNTVSVTRPGRWGNPLKVGQWKGYSAADAVRDYRLWIERAPSVRSFENVYGKPPTCEEIREHLAGKNLACFCALDQPCHRAVLFEIANAPVSRARSALEASHG